MRKTGTDPLLISMQWAKLQSVVDEASVTLLRTAFSRIVTEANDYTCALFDTQGNMIIQSTQGLTSFTSVLTIAIKHFLAAFPIAELAPDLQSDETVKHIGRILERGKAWDYQPDREMLMRTLAGLLSALVEEFKPECDWHNLGLQVARLLDEEAERARPDRRGPRGNGEVDEGDVRAGWAKLRSVLG